jgi:hypothetical protein
LLELCSGSAVKVAIAASSIPTMSSGSRTFSPT